MVRTMIDINFYNPIFSQANDEKSQKNGFYYENDLDNLANQRFGSENIDFFGSDIKLSNEDIDLDGQEGISNADLLYAIYTQDENEIHKDNFSIGSIDINPATNLLKIGQEQGNYIQTVVDLLVSMGINKADALIIARLNSSLSPEEVIKKLSGDTDSKLNAETVKEKTKT